METLETGDFLGNTISKKSIRITPSKRWCFTWNNPDINLYDDFFKKLETLDTLYIIGLEFGDNMTPHLQGYIEFKKKVRPLETFTLRVVHWEKCKGTREDNIKYCSKDNNFITNFVIKKPVKTLSQHMLYNWQKDIIDIINKDPDDRIIYWYWEPNGCTGKTTFCKYLSIKYGAVPLEGKKNDILYCAAIHDSNIYVWDLERSMEDFISYGALEKIKNGYYMCSKYESKPICRNCPHIFVFANFEPDINALSLDRWKIIKL